MVEGEQNTFARKMEDKYQDFIYLPHSEDFPDKALYNETDIHCNDLGFFQRGAKKSVDNEEFVTDLLDTNMTYRQKAIKYGRDYIRNFKTYEKFVHALRMQENILRKVENGEIIEDTNSYDPFEVDAQFEKDIETGEIIDHKKKAEE